MQLYLFALGAAVLAVTLLDVVWTTLSPGNGAGPLTGPLTRWAWRAAHRLIPRRMNGALVWVGPALLVATLVGWLVLLITGWTLVFSGDDSSLMNTRTSPPVPAELTGRIWYVTYTMFTVGNGDFTPNGGAYQMASSVLTLTGMSLATGGLTYAVSLASAVAQNRAFASSVFSLGDTASQMVAHCWTGTDVALLDLQLSTYATQLSTLTEKYRDYPIMQFYHPPRPSLAIPRALCALDDLLLVVRALPAQVRPASTVTTALSSSIDTFLEIAGDTFASAEHRSPPLPDLAPLEAAGVPVPEAGRVLDLADERQRRRAKLCDYAAVNGWTWPAD